MQNFDNFGLPSLKKSNAIDFNQQDLQRRLTQQQYGINDINLRSNDFGQYEKSRTQVNFNLARSTANPFELTTMPKYQRSIEDIISSIAKKISDQQIQLFAEFFYQYDVYQTRTFQSWELAIIFLDYISKDEADSLIQNVGDNRMQGTISYQALLNLLQQRLPYIQTGQIGIASIYSTKFKSQQIIQNLELIQNYFRQNHLNPQTGYDIVFIKSYIVFNEFIRFCSQINIRTINMQDQQQLFDYFTIGTNNAFSKINFVQALNSNNTVGMPLSFRETGQNFNQLPNQQPLNVGANVNVTTFINAFKSYIQLRKMTFEGFLNTLNIPNQQYLEHYHISDICNAVNLIFSQTDLNQIITALDTDRIGKVATQVLRQKIEGISTHFSQTPTYNNNNSYGKSIPFQNQTNNYGFGPQMKQMLEKIRNTLTQLNIIDLPPQFITVSMYQNKVVVDFDEFFSFLRAPSIDFGENEAMQICQEFMIQNHQSYKTQLFIDLENFQEQVFQLQQSSLTKSNSYQYYNVIQQAYQSSLKYIIMRGGNLITFFQEIDLNKDNYISKEELKMALSRLESRNVSDDEVNIIFTKMDQNGDGRISYYELCQMFADLSNTKAIKDVTHWSFLIFESIRKIAMTSGQSLAQLFGVTMHSISQKITISRDQFFATLSRLNIHVYGKEQKLLSLLEADQSRQYEIDFMHFSELVGMNCDQSHNQNVYINDYYNSPTENLFNLKTKVFYKSLQFIFEKNNIQQNFLQLLFKKYDPQNKGLIQQNEFIYALNEVDRHKNLDQNLMREISEKFVSQIGMQRLIDYQRFIKRLEIEKEKYKNINYVFQILNSAMRQNKMQSLKELFLKFDPNYAINGFDKSTLEKFFQQHGIAVSQTELSLILLEYDPQGTGKYLDFQSFNQDFKEFQSNNSLYNVQVKNKSDLYSNFISFSKQHSTYNYGDMNQHIYDDYSRGFSPKSNSNRSGTQYNNMPQISPSALAILQKIGRFIDSNPRLQFTQILLEHDYSKTGIVSVDDFQQLMYKLFTLNRDEIQHLVFHYNPMNRKEIRIEDFLLDIKDQVQDPNNKIHIANIILELQQGTSITETNSIQSNVVLRRYAKDFEEIQKAILVRKSDTYKWFESYSKNSQNLSRDDFISAIRALDISYLRQNDIDCIFDALQPDNRGYITIYKIDEAIRLNSDNSGMDMQDDLLEKIIRAFNGDDAYILQQLMQLDRLGHGYLNQQIFVDFFIKNSPPFTKFSPNDFGYLAQRYTDSRRNQTDIDINKFHSDLCRVKKLKYITTGYYSDIDMRTGQGYNQDNQNTMGGGHRNPFLSQYSKDNTIASQKKIQKFPGYRINLQVNYLEDIAKSTYVIGQLVQDYFQKFTQQGMNLYETDFQRAIQGLEIGWAQQTCHLVFSEIDKAFNKQRQKMMITAENIDQAVSFSCEKSLEELQHEMLTILASQISQRGMNLRQELQNNYDNRQTKLISVDHIIDLVLNRIRVPQLLQLDVVFLSKRYIETVPNMVHYEKLLDDVESISRGKFSNIGDLKSVADYIRKACIIKNTTLEQQFGKFSKMRDLLTFQEFNRAIEDLDLISNGVCTRIQIDTMFKEINQSSRDQITLQQLVHQINKLSYKQTKDFQEEIIDDICTKANAKNIMMENVFRQEDRANKGFVTLQSFENILVQQFLLKIIDAKIVANKYSDKFDNINYKMFLSDYQSRDQLYNKLPTNTYEHNTNYSEQVKQMLRKINDFAQTNKLQLSHQFSQYERSQSNGMISSSQFIASINSLNLPLSQAEKNILSEYYSVPRQPNTVDYLKFLSDLKLYGDTTKSVQNLTVEQRNLLQSTQKYIQKNNLLNKLVSSFQERDQSNKGYLTQHLIKDAFISNAIKFSTTQFNTLFGTLDTNQYGESNYRQMIELMYGIDEANKLFSLSTPQSYNKQKSNKNLFVMPQQPINAENSGLASIGKKLIQSNRNYEDEFKKKLGTNQVSSTSPKIYNLDIIDVLKTCKVFLSEDENIEFQAFIMTKQDINGQVDLVAFLSAIGLPPQTLGLIADKQLPKRILNEKELAQCQSIIIQIRQELNRINKTPQQVFEKAKRSSQEIGMTIMTFKLILASECGQTGKSITDQQIELLDYYLAQEIPNQISFKKLYLAFTLTDREPPLKQEGTEQIRQYQQQIQEQLKKGVPLEILDLTHFIRKNNLTMQQIFKTTQKGLITVQEFENGLKEVGFTSKNMSKIIAELDIKKTRVSVSLDKLNEFIRKSSPEQRQMTPQIARDKYTGFDPKTRYDLQKISDYMKRSNITLQKLYDQMDVNRDGLVEKQEFVNGLSYMNIPGLQINDLGQVFDVLDINNDNFLSINEFGMFIEGAKLQRMQRIQELDPKLIEDMKREIQTLFKQFDENGDGFVTCDEIFKSMMAIGQRLTMQDAKDMIATVDQNGDGKLDIREFVDLLLPKMKEGLLHQEDSLEDFRAMFLDADIDHSGTLSVDEIYSVILKLGAEVTIEELVELMNEIDVDRSGDLDIDEFIAFLSMGEEIQFRSAVAKNTFLNIKKAKSLKPLDFFKCFKNMPMNFVPSFFTEKWTKYKKNLPSSVLRPQIDPRTMLWKDMLPILSENLAPNQSQKAFQPRLRPCFTQVGCEIVLEGCEGVPIPQNGSGFDRSQIVKRAIRIGLYDITKKDFICNVVQVNANYNQSDEDIWNFNPPKEYGTNPILFKTSERDEIIKPNIQMIFELVVYVRFGERVTEMCCGWCQLDMALLDRQMTHKLAIKGGSPNAEVIIQDSDVHTKRSGLKNLMKVISSKINSQIIVNIKPHTKFTEETKFHLDLLPSTCFVYKRLLYFVSGFRNYAAEKLLKESTGTFKHPEGDIILSSFPKVFDCIDIIELLIVIWQEDALAAANSKQKLNVEFIMLKAKEFILKLYPILYAEEFKYKESNPTHSASGDQQLLRKREDLIKSALRYNSTNPKTKFDQPIDSLTSFKPFTVRELEFEIWDTTQAKQEKYMKQYEELGILRGDSSQNQSFTIQNHFPQQNINIQSLGIPQKPLSLGSALNQALR